MDTGVCANMRTSLFICFVFFPTNRNSTAVPKTSVCVFGPSCPLKPGGRSVFSYQCLIKLTAGHCVEAAGLNLCDQVLLGRTFALLRLKYTNDGGAS